MMKQLVIFDMDGTLADTSRGILNSHRHAHAAMGRPEPTDEELDGVIGGPLLQSYTYRFGFSEEDARKAVQAYREYYACHGIHEAVLYPGMALTLKALKDAGYKLGVATLKAERFAKIMLRELGVADLFDAIYGMDEQDTRTKAGLIGLCMEAVGASTSETTLVGDSIHDLNGARQSGISFVGVTYGFGFHEKADVIHAGGTRAADTCRELQHLLSAVDR